MSFAVRQLGIKHDASNTSVEVKTLLLTGFKLVIISYANIYLFYFPSYDIYISICIYLFSSSPLLFVVLQSHHMQNGLVVNVVLT